MDCPKCEAEAPGNYCANCGHKMFLGYCSNCRKEVFGNYCSHCGELFNRQILLKSNLIRLIEDEDTIILLKSKLRQSPRPHLEKKFLDRLRLAFASVLEFEVQDLSQIHEGLNEEMNLNEKRAASKSFKLSFEQVIVKTLAVLAFNAYLIDSAKGANNGLFITALVPFNINIWGGTILFAIEQGENKINLSINARIMGQAHEAGQSQNVIRRIHQEIEEIDIAQPNNQG